MRVRESSAPKEESAREIHGTFSYGISLSLSGRTTAKRSGELTTLKRRGKWTFPGCRLRSKGGGRDGTGCLTMTRLKPQGNSSITTCPPHYPQINEWSHSHTVLHAESRGLATHILFRRLSQWSESAEGKGQLDTACGPKPPKSTLIQLVSTGRYLTCDDHNQQLL